MCCELHRAPELLPLIDYPTVQHRLQCHDEVVVAAAAKVILIVVASMIVVLAVTITLLSAFEIEKIILVSDVLFWNLCYTLMQLFLFFF